MGADGSTTYSPEADVLKKDNSRRTLLVPTALMELLQTVIDVFHTDENGAVDPDRRLIPSLVSEGAGGSAAFKSALANAVKEEGYDPGHVKSTLPPQVDGD